MSLPAPTTASVPADLPAASRVAASADPVILLLDPGQALATAAFERAGGDLVARWADGTELTVSGYFDQAEPARLVTSQGEALSGALVTRLAGPLAPAQFAQADPLAADAAVGRVTTVEGEATATRPDGTVVPLAVGTPIGQGDVLATGSGAALAVTFADNTQFSLGSDARMVVDEFVYDPTSGNNAAAFDVLQGVFVFVSGEVAHTSPDAMTLTTPVATIGIRGTALALRLLPVGLQSLISLLTDPDGDLGWVSVTTNAGTVVLNDVNEATTLTSLDAAPGSPFVLTPAQLTDLFGAMLAALGLDPEFSDDDVPDGGDTGEDGAPDGEGDAPDQGGDTPTDGQGVEVTLADGLVTTLTPVEGPITIEGALTIAQLGVIGAGTLASGQNVIAIDGFGDDDDIIFLNVDADNVGVGTAGNDSFTGTNGADAFFAGAGNDHLKGLDGDDSLFGEEGNDLINGGDDNDLVVGDGLFSGDVGDDALFGGLGDDVLIGGSSNAFGGIGTGADVLDGGGGDDFLQPGPGLDSIFGGSGFDTLNLLDGTQAAQVVLQINQVLNDGFGNNEAITSIENVIGTTFDDVLDADGNVNLLSGNEGTDSLFGRGGNDVLLGGAGDDLIFGGQGSDSIAGDDGLGGGADTFAYNFRNEGGQVAANVPRGAIQGDVISDFESGQDRFHFALFDFNPDASAGPLILGDNFSIINTIFNGTFAGTNISFDDDQPTFIFSTADDTLYFDNNGNGAGYTVIATLANGETLAATDIEYVV